MPGGDLRGIVSSITRQMFKLRIHWKNKEAFGTAYAKGILRTLGISIKENSSQPESDKKAKYFVQVGAYSKRENAENQLQKAKDAGFTDAFIKEI